MVVNSREKILAAATQLAQAHGYSGLNFRDLAQAVGIRASSIYHHFPSKADLGAAVARRYWEDFAALLETLSADSPDPVRALSQYPDTFRLALANDNRICLASFMAAEFDDLPESVKKEVLIFTDINVAWLSKLLSSAKGFGPRASLSRARAIFAATIGAQLLARSRSDLKFFDELIASYRASGLLPEALAMRPAVKAKKATTRQIAKSKWAF